jgi:hypothetical protein
MDRFFMRPYQSAPVDAQTKSRTLSSQWRSVRPA